MDFKINKHFKLLDLIILSLPVIFNVEFFGGQQLVGQFFKSVVWIDFRMLWDVLECLLKLQRTWILILLVFLIHCHVLWRIDSSI